VGAWVGRPGRLYAKQPQDFDGQSPVPFWRARPELLDTRLKPDQPDQSQYLLAGQAGTLRVRLVYRRFWERVVHEKSWPQDDITIFDQIVRLEQFVLACRRQTLVH